MSFLAALEQPWCFAIILVVATVLIFAAALVAREQRAQQARRGSAPPAPAQVSSVPPAPDPISSAAPFEALASLEMRLQDIQRHLPATSDDADWLQIFIYKIRAATDQLQSLLGDTPESRRPARLEQLSAGVARLTRLVDERLEARLGAATDRAALERELARLTGS